MSKASWRQAGHVLRLMEEAGWDAGLVQTFEENWGGIRSITEALHKGQLTLDQLKAVAEGRFSVMAAGDDKSEEIINYFLSLSDSDSVLAFVAHGKQEAEASALVAQWRRLATSLDYSGSMVWQVKAGFTLKRHAPQAGPCHQWFSYLKDLRSEDEPTKDALVFWIPRLFKESTGKNVDAQMALLTDTRRRYELPEHHLTSYGQASLLSGLILAYFKATSERVPLNQLWTRTDTHTGNILKFSIWLGGFGEDGLSCRLDGAGDGVRFDDLGCFPLGVET